MPFFRAGEFNGAFERFVLDLLVSLFSILILV